jgi:antitoxin component of MazEF toxin-antitoxin module
MPIIRKLVKVGESKGITIPKSWIESAEGEAEKKIVAIALEVDKVITLSPVFQKEKEAVKNECHTANHYSK